MDFAFANSLDGSTFGLSCWIDSTATGGRLSDSAAVEHPNPRPHTSMTSFAFDSLPPGIFKGRKTKLQLNFGPRLNRRVEQVNLLNLSHSHST
jgi:hypothetical protein